MSFVKSTDFLIVGGGIIGLTIALEIRARFPEASILLIEKEDELGQHASGRNSGVLHAGFYYSADSIKANLTRQGNIEMTEYCHAKGINVNNCGKLVVTKNEEELKTLNELLLRGEKNKVSLELLSDEEAKKIEPRVKTYQQALYSPTTSSVNPIDVMESLSSDAINNKINILKDVAYLNSNRKKHITNKGEIEAGYFINAAGLYADKIAKEFGFSREYTILPFKGLYLYSSEPAGALKTNIYPVPNIEQPFLGVHFTITANNKVKIGPTAIPVFWRENYRGFERLNVQELSEIVTTGLGLVASNKFGFRKLAITELQKYYKPKLVKLAATMLDGVSIENYRQWAKPGIRAQLVNTKRRELEMDFHFEGDANSFHVLNAVSPAFTCAFPFSRLVVDKIESLIS